MFRPDQRIDSLLKQDFPDLTVEERDALRHYYGMREISNIAEKEIDHLDIRNTRLENVNSSS